MTKDESAASTRRLARVSGDGLEESDGAVDAELLTAIKNEGREVARGAQYNINERRFSSEEVRYCIWPGQSSDGRKHAEANDGAPAFPFEGASDARIRLADQIVNERVLILVAAALRNLPKVKGLELEQEGLGHKLTTLLKWVLKNKLGGEYFRTVTKLAQYQEGDSPSGAMLGIWWEQETGVEIKEVTVEQLKGVIASLMGLPPELVQATQAPSTNLQAPNNGQAPGVQTPGQGNPAGMEEAVEKLQGIFQELELQLMQPERDKETAQSLRELLPHVTEKRARKMVQELREQGRASYPNVYLRVDRPELCAYRLFEHIFLPANTAKAERARCYFIREWVDEVTLRERIVSAGYGEDFVEGVLGHEGQSGWPLYQRNATQGDFTVVKQEDSRDAWRGLYEVNTILWRAVNDDNVPGVYYLPFHFDVEEWGHGPKLLEYEHGEYPLKWFSREVLGERLLDARGVPELVATEQQGLKLMADSFNDNVSLATVPPIKVPRRRSKLSLVIGPLKVIKEDRPGDVSWMEPPQYPAGNEKQQLEIRRRVDEYWGRISESVAPLLTQLHQQGMTLHFLTNLSDGLTQVLQLCQQYMSEEELQQITGEDGIPIARSREEIQGKFSVELSFDPRDLDMEYLKTIVGLIMEILQTDTLNTIQRDKLVQRLFTAIDPNLAAATLRPVEDANQSEIESEKTYLSWIQAGVEPPMVAQGWNFPLRLQVVQQAVNQNPEYVKKLSPISKEIYEARVKYLESQVQQLKNAQIGRQVGKPVLGQGNGGGGQAGPVAPAGQAGISGMAAGR